MHPGFVIAALAAGALSVTCGCLALRVEDRTRKLHLMAAQYVLIGAFLTLLVLTFTL